MGALSGARVLVTGATGFIGVHLVNRLRTENPSRLVLVSRHPSEDVRVGEEAVACDLAEIHGDTWRNAAVDGFDVVFHLGAVTLKSRTSRLNPEEVVRSNVVGTQSLLASLPSRGCRIVFASAVDVFAPSDTLIDESSPVTGRELYPASKLMGEALVADWTRQPGASAVIARVGHVYGPGEGAYGKAVPTFIRAALEDRPLVVYGDGSAVRDLMCVTDVTEALLRAATASCDERSTVMILAGPSTTVAQLAREIAGIVNKPELVTFARDRGNGPSTLFSTQKMRRVIGEWDYVPLRVGLKAEVGHFRGVVSRA